MSQIVDQSQVFGKTDDNGQTKVGVIDEEEEKEEKQEKEEEEEKEKEKE